MSRVLAVALVVLAVACSGAPAKPAPVAATSAPAKASPPPPADLVFVASMPSFDHGLDGYFAFVERVAPDEGAVLRSQYESLLAKAPGIDLSRPMWVVGAGRTRDDMKFALVVATTDAKRLEKDLGAIRQRGGWTLASTPQWIDHFAPWTLETLVVAPAAKQPTVVVYTNALLELGATSLAEVRTKWTEGALPGMGPLAGMLFDDIIAGLRQTDRIELRFEATAGRASVDVALHARRGTGMAMFIAEQRPASFELVERMPMQGVMGVAAGRSVMKLVGSMYARVAAQVSPASSVPIMQKALEVFDHEGALAVVHPGDAGPAWLQGLFESPTPDWHKLMVDDGMSRGSVKIDPAVHDGVQIAHLASFMDLRLARWDGISGMVGGADTRKRIERVIDVSRKRVAPDDLPPSFADAIDGARRRRESFVFVADAVAFITSTPGEDGLVIGIGFNDGAAHVHAEISSAHVAAIRALRP